MRISTLFLTFTLVALAAALTALWFSFAPRSVPPGHPIPQASAPIGPPQGKAPPPIAADSHEPGIRSVYPGGPSNAALQPPVSTASDHAAAPPVAPSNPPAASANDVLPSVVPDRPPASIPSGETSEGVPVDEPASTDPALDVVDLNTAPVGALNGLGAGMIGKTIIANRPYSSPEDLVTRRILKRQDFELIKPRIVVR